MVTLVTCKEWSPERWTGPGSDGSADVSSLQCWLLVQPGPAYRRRGAEKCNKCLIGEVLNDDSYLATTRGWWCAGTRVSAGHSAGTCQLKTRVSRGPDEVRHSDTVPEDAVWPPRISFDHVIIHWVQQGYHGVVGVGPLYLVRVPLVKTELTIPERRTISCA